MEQGNDPMHALLRSTTSIRLWKSCVLPLRPNRRLPQRTPNPLHLDIKPIVALEFIVQAMIAFSRREKTMAETIVTRPGNMKL